MPKSNVARLSMVAFGAAALLGGAGFRAETPPQLPEGPGREQMVQACGRCHEAQRSAALRLTREGWDQVIGDMVTRGAVMTDEERTAVLDYLSTNFPGDAAEPLNINTATNITLESVAGLTRKEAAALLEWLKQNGPCRSLADLKKAPVDYKKIDDRKEFMLCVPPLPASTPPR